MNKNFILISVLFFIAFDVFSQNSKVQVLGRAQKDEILLRWAPTDAVTWQYGLKYGYIVERYTVIKDSVLVKPPTKIKLAPVPLKPQLLNAWEAYVEKNDYAAIAAQAIYGETFEITEDYGKDISQIVQKTKEQEQRFSFALFAADHSFKIAEMSGLAFEDVNVKNTEKYLYKVTAAIPDSVYQVKEGTVFIGLSDAAPLPKPIELQADFGNKIVHLKWNRTFFERTYNSYIVERSDDGGESFFRLNKEPLINTYEGEVPHAAYYYKVDTLPQNNKEYQYRVIGVTPFGEIGPPSETVKGIGSKPLIAEIGIVGHRIINNQQVEIKWKFPDDKTALIKGFIVQRSGSADEPFSKLISDTLSNKVRSFIDKKPLSTAYYKIGYVSEHQSQYSHPYLVQLEDSIPPAPPVGISYAIDSAGIVNLNWMNNKESDLAGYRVYCSNFKNSEFIQVTDKSVRSNTYTDTISLKTLTGKIFYKITAIDNRFNESASSDLLEVVKPDIIPPVPPVFKQYNVIGDTLSISWARCSSEDLSKYLLYKANNGSPEWELITEIDAIQSNLTVPLKERGKMMFTLIAVDAAGNQSIAARPITVDIVNLRSKGYFKDFKVISDRQSSQLVLKWKYISDVPPVSFSIYRAVNDEDITLYRKVKNISQEVDKNIRINHAYKYFIKAKYSDGSESRFSNEAKVNY